MAFSENAKKVYAIVKEAQDAGQEISSPEIAEKMGVGHRVVIGTLTGLQKKGIIARTPKTVKYDDGTEKSVSFITITTETDMDAE